MLIHYNNAIDMCRLDRYRKFYENLRKNMVCTISGYGNFSTEFLEFGADRGGSLYQRKAGLS
ncbi:hypothetical protein [Neisseria meningitidis]|uniref:hypothetical protein n=1 Tax=Neisseria meningitidis TaxID=487 RepID=UPI0003309452|nr:hypothetical protein [Neisseria meningitidis]EOB51161.1 hypothetical protein NM96060_2247 [Neisseria meningitidis 96060]MCL6024964.1 hypothetical protein [Neisseria meningitidis]